LKIKSAESAQKKLAELAARKSPQGNQSAVDELRAKVRLCEDRIAAFKAKAEADKIHNKIIQGQIAIDILAPGGLRQTKLKTCLGNFNALLKSISQEASWETVELSNDMSISYHGTPYMLLSKSEQFRVAVVLQIAIAKADGSMLVLIDGADILDSAGRNGLFSALTGTSAIIAMTINKSTEVPNLSKINGASYWIENAEAVRLHE
jgi:hypothetical protein